MKINNFRTPKSQSTLPTERSRLCWFSVFIRGNWVPVSWGEIDHERNTARFEQVPERLTGIASYYDGQRVIPCSQLMRIGPGGAQQITPDTTKTTLSLTRKFPVKTRLQYFNAQIIGTTIEGANQADFSDAVTLAVVSDSLKPYLQDLVISHPGDYRYYRILASSSHLHKQPFYYADGRQIFSNQPAWTDYGEEE